MEDELKGLDKPVLLSLKLCFLLQLKFSVKQADKTMFYFQKEQSMVSCLTIAG